MRIGLRQTNCLCSLKSGSNWYSLLAFVFFLIKNVDLSGNLSNWIVCFYTHLSDKTSSGDFWEFHHIYLKTVIYLGLKFTDTYNDWLFFSSQVKYQTKVDLLLLLILYRLGMFRRQEASLQVNELENWFNECFPSWKKKWS